MLSNKRQKIEHEDNTHLLDIGSTSEDHSSDVEFVITKEMLIENSDSEQETWTNDDAEFTRRIVERYGGNVSILFNQTINDKPYNTCTIVSIKTILILDECYHTC